MGALGALATLALASVALPAAGWGPGGQEAKPATKAAAAASRPTAVTKAEATLADFKRADPGLSRFFDGAVGWAVFPSVGKGGAGIGGAYGRGVLFERGEATGVTTLTQVTVGAQLGGQAYSELVFFETPQALAAFKKGQFAMAAQVSAVVAGTGTSADARYARGVAVFTLVKGGLMAEASVGGQRFDYSPFLRKVAGSEKGG
jgi:lipid-binding SYLF domain-containing protein